MDYELLKGVAILGGLSFAAVFAFRGMIPSTDNIAAGCLWFTLFGIVFFGIPFLFFAITSGLRGWVILGAMLIGAYTAFQMLPWIRK